MARVPWTRYEGDDIEAVVSMFLCREFPAAVRFRPSSGDGGVDVYVAVDDSRVVVYQVKKFAENLTASQKTQIAKSHKRIREYAAYRGWTIEQWNLVLPLDPTPENDEWFADLTASGDIPCRWLGLAVVDAWAAKYPDVVDYYLEGGRARLAEDLARFAAASGIGMSGVPAVSADRYPDLRPDDVQQQLGVLRDALNSRDPHFKYSYSVSDEPEWTVPRRSGFPAHVASAARQFGDSYVIFHVYARCQEALEERPITMKLTIFAEPGSAEARELTEFREFGRTPRLPLHVRDLTVDLPGGLGADGLTGMVAMNDGEPDTFERRHTIMSPEGETLAQVDFTLTAPDTNLEHTGISNHGTDTAEFLTIETMSRLNDGRPDMTFRFHHEDPTGRFPDEIEQSVAFLCNLTAPNSMRVAPRRGTSTTTLTIPEVERNDEHVAKTAFLLEYVRALIAIQEHVAEELRIPDLDTEDPGAINGVLTVARLLRGEIIEVDWKPVRVLIEPDKPLMDESQEVTVVYRLDVIIGGTLIPVGAAETTIEAATMTNVTTDEDGVTTGDCVKARDDARAQLRWVPDSELDEVPGLRQRLELD